MTTNPSEPDWTHLKQLAQIAQERFCRQVLGELRAILENEDLSCQARYGDAQDLLRRRHRDLVWAFEDLRRSQALDHLMAFYSLGLLRKGEVTGFSEAAGMGLEPGTGMAEESSSAPSVR